jgi:hypothetical protein
MGNTHKLRNFVTGDGAGVGDSGSNLNEILK